LKVKVSSKMPKTKKPRGGGKANEKDPAVEALAKAKDKMSPEDYDRYKTLLEDYDRQVEKKLEELENRAMAEADKAYRETMVQLMTLPTSIRNLNWEDNAHWIMEPEPHQTGDQDQADNVEASGVEKENKENELKELRDQIAVMKANAIHDVKDQASKAQSTVKGKGKLGGRNTGNGTKRLTAAAAATSGTPGGMAGSVDESILTSTINRTMAGNGGRGRRVLQTPGNISMVCPPATGRKPSKLNQEFSQVPTTPAVMAKEHAGNMRVLKPGEQTYTFTYSNNWSPLLTTAKATTGRGGRGRKGLAASSVAKAVDAKIDIGGERELQLNLDESDGDTVVHLDPEALAKIKAVRQKIDKLLENQPE